MQCSSVLLLVLLFGAPMASAASLPVAPNAEGGEVISDTPPSGSFGEGVELHDVASNAEGGEEALDRGELSTKVDAFAFGLVILEVLTGLPVVLPGAHRRTLLMLFEDELEEPSELVQRLDRHAPGGWGEHVPAHVPALHEIATQCLESRRRRRTEVAELVARLEQMRTTTEALPPTIPTQYLCPITQELMEDPVTTADGHAYERAAIEQWLGSRNTSPATGARLPHTHLIPAIALRQLIREFAEQNGL